MEISQVPYAAVWATYIGLFVTSCIVVSSMLMLIHYIAKSVFFWRYDIVADKMDKLLRAVIEANRHPAGNRDLAFIAGALLSVLRPETFSQQSLKDLADELQMGTDLVTVEEELAMLEEITETTNQKERQ